MMEHLKLALAHLDEEIAHMEASDHAFRKEYAALVSARRNVKRAIRKLEKESDHG